MNVVNGLICLPETAAVTAESIECVGGVETETENVQGRLGVFQGSAATS